MPDHTPPAGASARPVAPEETARYGSFELPWRASGAWLVSDPADLHAYLDGLSPRARREVQVVGELTNTVIAQRVPQQVVLFRGGRSMRATSRGDGTTILVVDASSPLDAVVAETIRRGLHGMELMSGIPGTVGGAVVQNAGAYGQEVADVLVEVRAYDRTDGEVVTLRPDDLRFGYRTTVLKSAPGFTPAWILLTVTLALRRTAPAPISYHELAEHHRTHGRDPHDLAERRRSVLEVRARKSMVVGGPNWSPSVGSFFVGPDVDVDRAVRIATEVRGPEHGQRLLDRSPRGAARVRIPAALVLRAAGFLNGDHWGPVGLGEQHILALCNRGGARGIDVLAVSRLVRRRVRHRLGIELVPEVRWLGDFPAIDLDAYARDHPLQPGSGEPAWARTT